MKKIITFLMALLMVCSFAVAQQIDIQSYFVTNGGYLTQGQQYVVGGIAKVTGVCDGCVIEVTRPDFATPFSISRTSLEQGACGNDKTVGVKFSVKDDYVKFYLIDTATKTGQYTLRVKAYNGCYADKLDSFKTLDVANVRLDVQEPQPEEQEPEQGSQDVTCYYCTNGALQEVIKQDLCPSSMSPNRIQCEVPDDSGNNDPDDDSIDPISCKVNQQEINSVCVDPCNTNSDCTVEGEICNQEIGICVQQNSIEDTDNWFLELFDFKNNTTQAITATALIILIVGLFLYIIWGRK